MVTHNFPAQFTSFIGREQELTDIAARLTDPVCRLLTLLGPGGIGKTRLAIEAAQSTENAFSDGIYFVPLQPITDVSTLPIAIGSAIGIQFQSAEEPRAQLLTFLRERSLLLVIDNFEHLLTGVDFLVEILTTTPVKLLVTSREALNVQAEWLYPVHGLDVPANEDKPTENYSAVQLFAERARRVRPDFAFNEQRPHVFHICRLVEGMPLGIELAAGWVKALSCAEIASEIQRGLDFLAADRRDMPERHRSMAAVFAQSWHLLAAEEQSAFRRLSVFHGGFQREAAEKVADASLRTLAALVDKSLLRLSPAGRYDLHELLRQFGEQQLEIVDEVESTRDAHCANYLDFLAQREADVKGRRQIAALDEIEQELENLRAAWYRGVDQLNESGIGGALECWSWFCSMRGHFVEHQACCTYARQQFAPQDGQKPRLLYGRILTKCATITGNPKTDPSADLCKAILDESLAIVNQYDDPHELGIVLTSQVEYLIRTDKPGALEILERVLPILKRCEDTFYTATALNWLAWCYFKAHQFQQALETIEEFHHIALRAGDIYTTAWGASFMSYVLVAMGRYEEKERWVREALRLMREVRSPDGISACLKHLGDIYLWRGDFGEAKELFDESVQLAEKFDPTGTIAVCTLNDGIFALFADEDYPAALRQFDEAYTFGLNSPTLRAPALCGLGNYESARKDLYPEFSNFYEGRHTDGLRVSIIYALLILAGQGKQEWAAQLMGLVSTWHRDVNGITEKWGFYQRTRAHLETDLGAEQFAAAWEQGTKLDLFEEAEKILAEWSDLAAPSPAPSPDALTERELEVLRLVVAGYSNPQIARDMIIAIGTVKAHVHRIYGKLGVESRTQAINRARERRLI